MKPLFCLSIIFIPSLSTFAQTSDSAAPSAPTSFLSDTEFEDESDTATTLEHSGGVEINDYGTGGKQQTVTIRGSKAADVGVSLEGIRLNSPNTGDFDFGNLANFGLENGKMIRGGYSPTSTNPGGEVMLHLPHEKIYRFHFGVGSYETFSIGMQTPCATLYVDQSENDFPFVYQGQKQNREHNFGQRANFRAWKRGENFQIWTQLLYSDQLLPGSVQFPDLAETQTLIPTIAYQGRAKNFDWAAWTTYQDQSYVDDTFSSRTVNRSISSGIKGRMQSDVSSTVQLDSSLEWDFDQLYSTQKNPDTHHVTPLRQTLAISSQAYFDATPAWLLNPRLRGEFVSDLNEERFSIHPGLGTRYRLGDSVDALANVAWISRAPNFNEMYFQIANLDLENRDLVRQRSLQGDVGYNIHTRTAGATGVKFQQAFFWNRTEKLLQIVQISPDPRPVYQVKNLGISVVYGLENSLSIQWARFFRAETSYTLQFPELSSDEAFYQPRHSFSFRPHLFPDEWMSLSLPLSVKSSMRAIGGRVNSQADLGMTIRLRIQKTETLLQFFNLLHWNREEIFGYPMSQETSVKISTNVTF
jgi:hypothetical protein